MTKASTIKQDEPRNDELLKKLLMLELFKLGMTQAEIGKKLKMKTAAVNAFLKGIEKPQ
jgi:predicted transcriptional regulator